jgi:uncharacterized phiE125 gp8 family phage protein
VRTPRIIEDVAVEPITVTEARAHLEAQPYEDSDVDPVDDTMIEGWISAARELCEQFVGLSLATKTLEIALDTFPDDGEAVDLPFGPVREVYSVSWGDESDTEMAAADYTLDNYRKPNQLRVASAWPTVTESPNVVKIRYLAGYGVDSDGGEALPKLCRAAILLTLGYLYQHRGDDTEAALPKDAEYLLRPLRVRLGMA